jgi:hypothetical protein
LEQAEAFLGENHEGGYPRKGGPMEEPGAHLYNFSLRITGLRWVVSVIAGCDNDELRQLEIDVALEALIRFFCPIDEALLKNRHTEVSRGGLLRRTDRTMDHGYPSSRRAAFRCQRIRHFHQFRFARSADSTFSPLSVDEPSRYVEMHAAHRLPVRAYALVEEYAGHSSHQLVLGALCNARTSDSLGGSRELRYEHRKFVAGAWRDQVRAWPVGREIRSRPYLPMPEQASIRPVTTHLSLAGAREMERCTSHEPTRELRFPDYGSRFGVNASGDSYLAPIPHHHINLLPGL